MGGVVYTHIGKCLFPDLKNSSLYIYICLPERILRAGFTLYIRNSSFIATWGTTPTGMQQPLAGPCSPLESAPQSCPQLSVSIFLAEFNDLHPILPSRLRFAAQGERKIQTRDCSHLFLLFVDPQRQIDICYRYIDTFLQSSTMC